MTTHDDIKRLAEATERMRVVIPRKIKSEIVRHRQFSQSAESTRTIDHIIHIKESLAPKKGIVLRPSEEAIAAHRALERGLGAGPLVSFYGYGGYGGDYYNRGYEQPKDPSADKKIVHRRKLTAKTGQGYSNSGTPINKVSAEDIARETEAAKTWCRRNLREWPHEHVLRSHVVGDEIVFWFEKE